MRKTLLAAVLTFTAMAAHADYQCSVTPRDDVILSPQTVQVLSLIHISEPTRP